METTARSELEPRQQGLNALEDELAELSAHMNAAMARWLSLLGEFDRRGGAAIASCERWLAWRCGVSPGEARELVRVARALADLPVIREAFARGELTYTKVRALTRVATPACERSLLELAAALSASQLKRALRAYRRVSSEEARKTHVLEYVSYYWAEDGSLVLKARLPSEDGTVLVRALDAARDRVLQPEERRPPQVEALVDIARRSLAGGAEHRAATKSEVVVHVDAVALAADAPGRCELEEGPVIAAETARRLACDASTVAVVERDGLPLSVGRRRRAVPAKLRRALEARDDRSCQWPGCTNGRHLHAHHRRHWAHGGETSLDNLILLCGLHHRLVHEGGYAVETSDGGGLRFRIRHGVAVASVPRPPPGSDDALLERNRQAGLKITKSTNRNGDGDRMDLGLAVEAIESIVTPTGWRRAEHVQRPR
jgi:hypothetical protein